MYKRQTYKDPETGVVRQDYDKCIGCGMCMSACPYNGVRSFNWEEPVFHMDYACLLSTSLEREGYISTRKGRGTFVAERHDLGAHTASDSPIELVIDNMIDVYKRQVPD